MTAYKATGEVQAEPIGDETAQEAWFRRYLWTYGTKTARDLWCSPASQFSDFHPYKRRRLRRAVCTRCGYRRAW